MEAEQYKNPGMYEMRAELRQKLSTFVLPKIEKSMAKVAKYGTARPISFDELVGEAFREYKKTYEGIAEGAGTRFKKIVELMVTDVMSEMGYVAIPSYIATPRGNLGRIAFRPIAEIKTLKEQEAPWYMY